MTRVSLLLLITICLVSAASAQQQQLSHPSNTYYIQPPNGTDDTANIQAGLDACIARGKGCTVQLAAGRYLTRQLVAYNFRGTFRGMGRDRTTIEALPNLPVNLVDWYTTACAPNLTTCPWSTLIMFVDGDIHVSDLSVKITAPPGTATTGTIIDGSLDTDLMDVIRFMGQRRTEVCVERVAIEGLPDDSRTSWGFNILNGIVYAGEFPRSSAPYDFYFLSGTFTIRNSFFKNITAATGLIGFNKDSRVTIGGSHSTGNKFENISLGIGLCSSENSVFDVSFNVSGGTWDSLWVLPWSDVFVPSKPSLYFIHDNTFKPSGPNADGIYLLDGPTTKWIHAVIYNNNIEAQDIGYGGISAHSTNGTSIVNNKVSGNGGDAIGIWDGSYAAVLGNDVTGITSSPELAQIVLDETTNRSIVVCENANDTVLNQGTMNRVIGCQQPATATEASTMSAAPATSVAQPDHLRRKLPPR